MTGSHLEAERSRAGRHYLREHVVFGEIEAMVDEIAETHGVTAGPGGVEPVLLNRGQVLGRRYDLSHPRLPTLMEEHLGRGGAQDRKDQDGYEELDQRETTLIGAAELLYQVLRLGLSRPDCRSSARAVTGPS